MSVLGKTTLGVAGGVRGRVPPLAGWRLPEQDLTVLLNRHPRDYSQQLRGRPWEGTGLGERGPGLVVAEGDSRWTCGGPDRPFLCPHHCRYTPQITPAITSHLAPRRLWVRPRACQVCMGWA